MSVRRKAIAAAGSMPPPLLQLPATQNADNLPPPSSVAAIVQNFKTGDGTRLLDRDIFQQLLAEVLGTDSGDPTDTAGFEDNVGVNYKVVEVVMDAGLSVLLQEDPFASKEDLLLQASNSLLVVRLTIQRSPQVLFCPPPVESGVDANRPVLFLWLLPRLFPLLGHKATETLVGDILETVEALFVAAAKIPGAWKYLKTVMWYCQSCVTCIVESFRSNAMISAAISGLFKLELPGEAFTINSPQLSKLYPTMTNQTLGFTVRDMDNAASVAVHLFSLISRVLEPSSRIPALRTTADNFVWFLQGISKLWKSLNVWESLPTLYDRVSSIRVKVLEALVKSVDQMPKSQYGSMKCESLCLFAIRSAAEVLKRPLEKVNERTKYALAGIFVGVLFMAEKMTTVNEFLKEQILPLVAMLMNSDENWALLDHDLQVTSLRLVFTVAEDSKILEKAESTLQSTTEGKWSFKDKRLNDRVDQLQPIEQRTPSEKLETSGGPRKRLKLMDLQHKDETHNAKVHLLVLGVNHLLGNQETDDLRGLGSVAGDGFSRLSEAERCNAVKNLGILSCALAGSLTEGPIDSKVGWGPYKCSYCDAETITSLSTVRHSADGRNDELFRTLEVLLKLDTFQRSVEVRAWAVMGLRRMLNHTRDVVNLSLAQSVLGKWCVNALQSSKREIRIAAGRTLPSFVGFDHSWNILKDNRVMIIEFLRTLSEGDDLPLQETCVLAWSQLGRVSSGDELNLVLIRLVDYLGHANSFIVGVAYNEIQSLAQIHDASPRKLLSPYWRSISVGVVRQLQSKPQIAQLLSELLLIDVSEYLKITQHYTLPYMVLWKRPEIVEKIAQAVGLKIWDVCHNNLAAILALLLAQDGDDVEQATMTLLVNTSAEFRKCSFTELVRPEAVSIVAELLKASGDEEGDRKAGIHDALVLVASLSHKQTTRREKQIISYLDVFFETHVLGIFNLFIESLKDVPVKQPIAEKIRTLKAIEEMVRLAKGCISGALPQITACLQSALESEPLRTSALSAWSAMMMTLPEDDISPLLGQTFSLLLQYWENLQEDAKETVHKMVVHLFSNHSNMIEKDVAKIPSLASVPLLSKFEKQLVEWRRPINIQLRFRLLASRCRHENVAVVEQALIELTGFIRDNQKFLHTAAINEQPDRIVPELIRTLLDVIVTFKDSNSTSKPRVERLCAECLGLVGAVDPNRVEAPRAKRDMMVLHNFERADESVAFVVFLLEERLVKAFLSATDTKAQGFLSWAMQELLKFIDVTGAVFQRTRGSTQNSTMEGRWGSFSQVARDTLAPFLKSKYKLHSTTHPLACSYPIFSLKLTHRLWLQALLLDLLSKTNGENASQIFGVCSRIVKGQDASIPTFLLPFVVLNVIIGGTLDQRNNIANEILAVLRPSISLADHVAAETLRNCSETVFLLVDHLTRWLRDKKKYNTSIRAQKARQQNRHPAADDEDAEDIAVQRVEEVLSVIPPDMMGLRSFECNSYARALFHWEQHIRQTRDHLSDDEMIPLYEKLQNMYTEIDEPDGIEGISTKLHVLNMDQQILEHRKAGRWTAAQSWYELLLSKAPDNLELQTNLLTCLKQSGQYELLLNQADEMMTKSPSPHPRILEFAVEASWISGKWDVLDTYLSESKRQAQSSYEIKIGSALSALRKHDTTTFASVIASAREDVVNGLTESLTGSLRQCHDSMVRLHSLAELEEISLTLQRQGFDRQAFAANLERRLDVLGTYSNHKQYILALRRAAFQLSGTGLVEEYIASTWLASARFARKAGQIHQSFNSVLHALNLGTPLAALEHAKLLWHEGQHRKAIQNLEGAIATNMLRNTPEASMNESNNSLITMTGKPMPQSIVIAKAVLLLARWLDGAGQTHSTEIISKYSKASAHFVRWEQGHYFLGRHYNKLYEAEKALPLTKQSPHFINGETAKLVCQSYLRALAFGTKYIFQTMPRLLTLWLDLGDNINLQYSNDLFREHAARERSKNLKALHVSVRKYGERLPAWMFYTAFPQILSRIVHSNELVYEQIQWIVVRVVSAHPQQALWSLAAVCKSTSRDRSSRGARVIGQIKESLAKGRKENSELDLKLLIAQSQRLTDQLLNLCNADVPQKVMTVSLMKDLGFHHHNVAPCLLVIPLQTVLTVTLPPTSESLKNHIPFASHQPTIAGFADEADIMTSLQRPRKIKMRGSDGKSYPFLCKPKDDLRKDARLMEFNNMINRFLKKDVDSSRRRLYIRTYFVTPLNEECGLIEWVNNVRPLRDILLKSYKAKRISVNYGEIRNLLDEACSNPSKNNIFTDVIIPRFPPVFHEWFVEMFSEPAAWFASRIAYSRTLAVMSMVGHVLGLGDRHGENILFDEISGDTLHVDFNCLFDKGLSFEKPERVPFRLTQNMVDALGVVGYEGTFRKTCETAMRVLRNNEDTLMTVLETFLHDPAVDMVRKKKTNSKIPDSPKAVLESIQNKLRGLFQGETVPLSVEGQVQELLRMAVHPENLCAMYIGWCAFF